MESLCPGNKNLGIHPTICLYEIEDDDKTEEGEEKEIFVIQSSSLAASKQNLVKRKFHWIDTFDNEGPSVINAMHDLTVRVFEHLEVPSKLHMDI